MWSWYMCPLSRKRWITTALAAKTSMPCNLSAGKVLVTKILDNPPNIITFSVHGATKSVFETISVKSQYERCIESLTSFMASADLDKTEVRILCALQKENLLEHKEMFQLMKRFDLLKINDPEAGHVDLELYFFTEVLKLKSLHYGLGAKDQDHILANLGAAQAAYTVIESH